MKILGLVVFTFCYFAHRCCCFQEALASLSKSSKHADRCKEGFSRTCIDCKTILTCNNSKAFEATCDKSCKMDSEDAYCSDNYIDECSCHLQDGFFKDRYSESSYLVCKVQEKNPQIRQCPDSMIFDSTRRKCQIPKKNKEKRFIARNIHNSNSLEQEGKEDFVNNQIGSGRFKKEDRTEVVINGQKNISEILSAGDLRNLLKPSSSTFSCLNKCQSPTCDSKEDEKVCKPCNKETAENCCPCKEINLQPECNQTYICPEFMKFNNNTKTCETSLKLPQCTETGLFASALNCSNYYACIRSANKWTQIPSSCNTPGHFFNEKTRTCEDPCTWKDNDDFQCRVEGRFGDPRDCHSFIECIQKKDGTFLSIHRWCPGTFFWDGDKTTCTRRKPDSCKKKIVNSNFSKCAIPDHCGK